MPRLMREFLVQQVNGAHTINMRSLELAELARISRDGQRQTTYAIIGVGLLVCAAVLYGLDAGGPHVLGLSGAVFVALIGSLLTAIPLSPAGLGFAQAGVIGVLTVAYGVPLPEATAITILDWVISVLSIIVFGAVVYVVSPMPRGMGRIPQPPGARAATTA
jgi:uncharacterized membrane protein YbhN (UPF0104 family)